MKGLLFSKSALARMFHRQIPYKNPRTSSKEFVHIMYSFQASIEIERYHLQDNLYLHVTDSPSDEQENGSLWTT